MKPTSKWGRALMMLLKLGMIFLVLCPIVYAVDVSFMTTPEIFRRPPTLIPSSFSLDSYQQALKTAPLFWRGRFLYRSSHVIQPPSRKQRTEQH